MVGQEESLVDLLFLGYVQTLNVKRVVALWESGWAWALDAHVI